MTDPDIADLPAVKPRHIELFASAAELSPLPFLLCDTKGKILGSSRGARSLLTANHALECRHQRLQLASRPLQQQFIELLERGAAGEAPDPRSSSLLMKVPRDNNSTLTLMVSALPDFSAPPLAVYMHEPHFTARISESALCALYDLTPAEARVARIMVNGASTREIADHNQTSVHTVRNQMKNVFTKTGASRQAELAILLLGGPAHTR